MRTLVVLASTTCLAESASCRDWCIQQQWQSGSVKGTAPACGASCGGDCTNGSPCTNARGMSDYGSSCWSGDKVCCCSDPIGPTPEPSQRPAYDPQLGMALAKLARSVNCGQDRFNSWSVGEQDFQVEQGKTRYITNGDTEGVVGVGSMSEPNGCFVAFAGTGSSNVQRVIDGAAWLEHFVRGSCSDCWVHAGWQKSYESNKAAVFQALQDFGCQDRPLFLTGHSLGAAVLHYLLYDAMEAGFQVAGALAMESPRPGDDNFATGLQRLVSGTNAYRVTHYKDIVPHVPPKDMVVAHYLHALPEIYYKGRSGTDYEDCGMSDGTSNCANQWALTDTTPDDHCWYADMNPCGCGAQGDEASPMFVRDNATLAAADPASDILTALNSQVDSVFNPTIASHMPDPLDINVQDSTSADAGCIVPNPFGGCICHLSAGVSAHLDRVQGLKTLRINQFDSLSFSEDLVCLQSPQGCSLTLGATVQQGNLIPQGGAKAEANACGINAHPTGTASTHASATVSLTATATATPHMDEKCVQLSITQVGLHFDQVQLHDTHVTIDLGILPLDVGKLVDLVQSLAPNLGQQIANGASGDMQNAIMDAVNQLPCIKIPFEDKEVDVVV